MKVSEILNAFAGWLENPDNEALLLAQDNDKCLEVVASACVRAAAIIKEASDVVDGFEDEEPNKEHMSVEDLATLFPDAFNALPEPYKADSCLEFYYDKPNDIVFAYPINDYEKTVLGFEEAMYTGHSWEITINYNPKLKPEMVDSLADFAALLDASGDERFMKKASLIDDLLITISSSADTLAKKKAESEDKIEFLRKKYQDINKQLSEVNKTADALEVIDNSDATKDYKQDGSLSLSTRYCPDHAGEMCARVGDNIWQCSLDKKVYDYNSGFELMDGTKVPASDVANQTDFGRNNETALFDTREGRLNSGNY